MLEEQRDLIETYVSWYDGVAGIRPVALADVWADASYSSSHLVEEPRAFTESADGLTMGAAETLPAPAQLLLSNQEEAEAAMTVDEATAFLGESGGG